MYDIFCILAAIIVGCGGTLIIMATLYCVMEGSIAVRRVWRQMRTG